MPLPPVLVLIGPAAAGKSTLGRLVAAELDATFVDLDEVADVYYREVGWSIDRLASRIGDVGRVAAEREWEPARAHAVARVVDEHPQAVVALGAGHTSFVDPRHLELVRRSLSQAAHVALVLPFAERRPALAELRSRSLATKGTDWVASGHDFLAEWFDDPGTRSLATLTFVTEGEPPETSAQRLAAVVRDR